MSKPETIKENYVPGSQDVTQRKSVFAIYNNDKRTAEDKIFEKESDAVKYQKMLMRLFDDKS